MTTSWTLCCSNNHNLSHGRIQFLKSKLENNYLLLNLPKQEDPQLAKYITEINSEAAIEKATLF